ncbi:unnamed protein product, partial [Mesorhabditis spiculigera]
MSSDESGDDRPLRDEEDDADITKSDDEQPAIASDDDDEPAERSSSKKNRKRKVVSDDEEDDEEEEDDDDDDEDSDGSSRRKKHKKGKKKRRPLGADFILHDVDVDDDDVEEDDLSDDEIGALDRTEREEAEKTMRELDAARRKEHDRRNMFKDMSAEEIAKYYEERYADESRAAPVDYDDDAGYSDDITQTGLLPSTKDPNLWIVKCRMGEEKLVCMQLMRKAIAYETTENPLQIKSVIYKEGLKGMLYVEAFKQAHVTQAVEGIGSLNQFNVVMVPIKEMVDSLRVVKNIPQLKPGTYVRLKRTQYKDDLAQVDWVDVSQNKVNLKLLPRIDYTKMRGALRTDADRAKKGLRRPGPQPFNLEKIKEIGGEVTNDGDFIIFEGQHYRRGFLYKSFPLYAIIDEGVKPTIAELEKFQETSDDLKKDLEKTSLKASTTKFSPGDIIEVAEGELVNLRGKVITIDGDQVHFMPEHEDLDEPITLSAADLRKFFKPGDHVKVLEGKYEGDTGLIIRAEPNEVVIYSDLTNDEMRCRPRDVQLCADVSSGVDSLGKYQFHDLVQIDRETVGMITRLEKENVEVLNMYGKIVKLKPQALLGKKEDKWAQALDQQGNSIQVKDAVKVVDGPFHSSRPGEEEKTGEIKHLFRTFCFVHSRKFPENGGIFVTRPRCLLLQGAKVDRQQDAPGLSRMPAPFASPRHAGSMTPGPNASPMRGGSTPGPFQGGPATNIGNAKVRRDTSMVGKSVRITKGPLKGYFGIVKDATAETMRVELHASCKTILVDASRIKLVSDVPGGDAVSDYLKTPSSYTGTKTPAYAGGNKTPAYGAQTPAYHQGGRTPHYGAQTPAYGDGGRTPAYADGGRTPAYGEGGRTPAYADGGRTPGYGDGGRTPAYGSEGARTPGYESMGGRTPAYGAVTPARSEHRSPSPASSSDDEEDRQRQPEPQPEVDYDSPASPNYAAPTPGSMNPRTPSAYENYPMSPGGYSGNEATGSSIPQNYLDGGEWLNEGMMTTIRNNYDKEEARGMRGKVEEVHDEYCVLWVNDLESKVRAYFDQLLPVKPDIGTLARVIYGDETGCLGTVVSIDGSDAIIQIAEGDLRLVEWGCCCQIVHDG